MNKLIKSIAVLLIIVLGAGAINYANVFYSRKKVNAKIESITMIENPSEIDEVAKVLDKTVNDVMDLEESGLKDASDEEKNMRYSLDDYNVYKIDISVTNESKMDTSYTRDKLCSLDKYIAVPSDFTYDNAAAGFSETSSYYYFISKNYSIDDVKSYLENNGISLKTVFDRRLSAGDFNIIARFHE